MKKKQSINCPRDAVRIAKGLLLDKNKEHFIGIYLSARNTVNKAEIVSIGTLNANLVHPREVFRPALITRSASLIVLHNHPSGDTAPSEADVEVTSRLKEVGDIFGIDLTDHIIFDASGTYYSFRDEGGIK